MEIIADKLGWSIDAPCITCGRDNCQGRLSMWTPNRLGNSTDGYDTVEEAIEDAKYTQESRRGLLSCT